MPPTVAPSAMASWMTATMRPPPASASSGQSLVIVADAGPESAALLGDGSAIQRTIADAHGARRFAQGWDEDAVRRDHQVFREEVERAVRSHIKAESEDVAAALNVLLRLVDRAEAISVAGWRRAASVAGGNG